MHLAFEAGWRPEIADSPYPRRFISQEAGSIDRSTPQYLARRVRCDVIDRSPKGKRYTETEVGASRLDGILTSPPGRWRMLPACAPAIARPFVSYGMVRCESGCLCLR